MTSIRVSAGDSVELRLIISLFSSITSRAYALVANRTARQAAQMTALRFIGLGIGAVAQIYAARQLGPEKLGISGMALAAVAQGSILVTLGANTLLVREYKEAETEEKKQSLISAAYTLRTIITVGLGLLLLVALPWLWPQPHYLLATACVLPLIFFESNQALWVLQAEERVPAQYFANVASALVSAVLIFAFISPSSPAGSDMLAAVGGMAFAFGLSWRFAQRSLPCLRFDWRAISNVVFGTKWLFLSAIVIYAYSRFEQPLVGWLRSVEELGVYRSAWQILGALQPFLSMVSLLLYPRLIAWKQESPEKLWERQCEVAKVLFWCALIAALLISTVVPWSYTYIYGQAYVDAAWPCVLIIVAKLIAVVNIAFSYGLWAQGKDKLMLSIMTAAAIGSIGSNIVIIPQYGILGAATVNVATEVFVCLLCLWFSYPRKSTRILA
jgi:O-antigen/teichoic acid export membrane protein